MLVCQGRAVADGRYAVGRFSDPVARRLLDHDELVAVEQVRAEEVPTVTAERLTYEVVRRTAVVMATRTVAIDDANRHHGAGQVVILGAGLDARAWRMPELNAATVIEVDHTGSQQDKTRRLGALRAGLEPGAATTWVCEGVIPYLSRETVRGMPGQVAELSAPDSRLVLNYQATSLLSGVVRRVMRGGLRLVVASRR